LGLKISKIVGMYITIVWPRTGIINLEPKPLCGDGREISNCLIGLSGLSLPNVEL